MSSVKVAYLFIILLGISMTNVNSWRRRRRSKKDILQTSNSLRDSVLPMKACEKEGLYAVEGGRLIPSSVIADIPIECNQRYCRSRSHLGRGAICWRCSINSKKFIRIHKENIRDIKCDLNSIGYQASSTTDELSV